VAALTGCGDPTVTPSVSMSPSVSASDTPSPSPTPVIPAEHDPSWTENQLAAVRVVDEYELLMFEYKADLVDPILIDGKSWMNTRPLENVVSEPALEEAIKEITTSWSENYLTGGIYTIVDYVVGAEETTTDDRQQITVLGCIDTSALALINSVTGREIQVDRSFFRMLYTYTVQRESEAEDWRIVLVRGGDTEC
jgi:hypothetical protein